MLRKHVLHSELQNVCEISSGLGKLQQQHENPHQNKIHCGDWGTRSCRTNSTKGRRGSKPHSCITHTRIRLAGAFSLTQRAAAKGDTKGMPLPPEKVVTFADKALWRRDPQPSDLSASGHPSDPSASERGSGADWRELLLMASTNVHISEG